MEPEARKRLAARIRAARDREGYSLYDVARMAALTISDVIHAEAGRDIGPDKPHKLCTALQIEREVSPV